jgi:hypothetical protein
MKRVDSYNTAIVLMGAVVFFGALASAGAQTASGGTRAFTPPAAEWRSIVFGQSITASDDTVVVEPAGSVVVSSLNGKGKVTGSHDGIAYYYVAFDPIAYNFVLSADIEVITFANDGDASKTAPNNQEGFGIMIRDAIGADGDSGVFASNIVYAGGYRSQTQAVMRENVMDQSGAGARMVAQSLISSLPKKGTRYTLTIKKSNTGYHVLLNNDPSTEVIFYKPSLMQYLNPDKLYAGFFAARNASIRVSNIKLGFSNPATDPAKIPEPPKPVVPSISQVSVTDTPLESYDLVLSANVSGTLAISRGGKAIAEGLAVKGGVDFIRIVGLTAGENVFDLVFTPIKGQLVTSEEAVKKQLKIIRRTIGSIAAPLFASPAGIAEGDGSAENPVDVATAVKYVLPGQTIALLEGTYQLAAPLIVSRGNDGMAHAIKTLAAYRGAKVTFDFGGKGSGLQVFGNYWKIFGIDVTKSSGAGIRIAGNENVLDNCRAIANGNTGIQINGSSADPRERWPANNLIVGCTAFDNSDPAEEDADGFAAKLTVGRGNVFRNCVSRNNCDDGWDLYTKLETGAIEPVLIENCVAYGNGILSNGRATKGDGNGFKLGGEGISVKHIARGCTAFANAAAGFTCNSNPAAIIENAVSCDNGDANFDFSVYTAAVPAFSLKNLYSFRTAAGVKDNFVKALLGDAIYLFDGTSSLNAQGVALTANAFVSLKPPSAVVPGADGKPALGGYLELKK